MFLGINHENSYIPMASHSGFLYIFAYDIRFLQGNGYFYLRNILYKFLIISSFARSIVAESIEARYICVVTIES